MRHWSNVALRNPVVPAALILLLAFGLLTCRAPAPPPVDSTATSVAMEAPAIRQALHEYVDKNPASGPVDLEIAQVGVDTGYALVTWTHGKEAGQAVLRKQQGAWEVVECGAGWLGLRGICKEQVPTDVAQRLLDQVDPRWGSYETP